MNSEALWHRHLACGAGGHPACRLRIVRTLSALFKAPLLALRNYATLSRNFSEQTAPNLGYPRKGQTLSGKFLNLSTLSIESPRPKIQTLSGAFRRRRLRNSEATTMVAGIAWTLPFDILPIAHPPSLWLCQAQMWRVFLSLAQHSGGAM